MMGGRNGISGSSFTSLALTRLSRWTTCCGAVLPTARTVKGVSSQDAQRQMQGQDHLVRKIDIALDLSWHRRELAPHYSSMGRPSIDRELVSGCGRRVYVCRRGLRNRPSRGQEAEPQHLELPSHVGAE